MRCSQEAMVESRKEWMIRISPVGVESQPRRKKTGFLQYKHIAENGAITL
ncbi:hypothetical protein [uncultured Exiguobacterium sp.]|nr:hypothetical protein [uncultured Exiguobacterium sp.]